MSTPSADPSRLQTRAKNADQHSGKVIQKGKRRTKAQMEAARALDREIAAAAKKVKEEQIQAAAKMEDEIVAKDKEAAGGIATKKVRAKVSTTTVKKVPAPVPVVSQPVALNDDSESGEKTGDVEMASDEAPADSTQDRNDGNATASGEESEDEEEQPRKSRKVQRGETREIIKEKRKAATAAEVVDDGRGKDTALSGNNEQVR